VGELALTESAMPSLLASGRSLNKSPTFTIWNVLYYPKLIAEPATNAGTCGPVDVGTKGDMNAPWISHALGRFPTVLPNS
jgi:hypothetical protein